jgi:hypothetical protein
MCAEAAWTVPVFFGFVGDVGGRTRKHRAAEGGKLRLWLATPQPAANANGLHRTAA